ncbi:MAG: MBL fold metallo-hydrolase, partial [Solirubrobacteraceae bacterium]
MEITVLGKSPAVPDADGACSGYLVSEGDFRLVIDCGTGVVGRLRAFCELTEVDAVVITHVHADHIADLLPYSHALTYRSDGGERPRLLAPPGGDAVFAAVGEAYGVGRQIHEGFAVEEYDPSATVPIGPLQARFCEVPHFIRAWACELAGPDGRRFSFGADCAPNPALAVFAQEADLLLLEATEGPIVHVPDGHLRGHMS